MLFLGRERFGTLHVHSSSLIAKSSLLLDRIKRNHPAGSSIIIGIDLLIDISHVFESSLFVDCCLVVKCDLLVDSLRKGPNGAEVVLVILRA